MCEELRQELVKVHQVISRYIQVVEVLLEHLPGLFQ